MCVIVVVVLIERERHEGEFNNEYYHHRTTRREHEEEEGYEEEKQNDGDVLPLLPLISPRPPLLFICLPFLTTFNTFLWSPPSHRPTAKQSRTPDFVFHHRPLLLLLTRTTAQATHPDRVSKTLGCLSLLGFLRALFVA